MCAFVSTLIAGVVLLPSHLYAHRNGRPVATETSTATRKKVVKRHSQSSIGKKVRASRRGRYRSYRQRLASLHLQPQRVEEIQRALIEAGYLNQEPTGRWDDQTREAMRRYQQDHGFPPTGLPEARTLMKLGLGPHPLPEDVDPMVKARASTAISGEPAPDTSTDPPSREEPAKKNPTDEKP